MRPLDISQISLASSAETTPSSGSSSPESAATRVDLPEPDGPMTAVNRPPGRSTLTSSRARTAVPSDP